MTAETDPHKGFNEYLRGRRPADPDEQPAESMNDYLRGRRFASPAEPKPKTTKETPDAAA
jgi:hypothetical protein